MVTHAGHCLSACTCPARLALTCTGTDTHKGIHIYAEPGQARRREGTPVLSPGSLPLDDRYPRPSDWLQAQPGSFACPPLGVSWDLRACLSHLSCLRRFTNVLSYVVLTTLEGWLGKGVIILIRLMKKHTAQRYSMCCPSSTRMCPTKDEEGLASKGLLTGDLVSHRALTVL